MTNPTQPTAEATSRAEFEAWASRAESPIPAGLPWDCEFVAGFWRCWQAARRTPADDARDAVHSEFEVHLTMAGTDDEMVAAATSGPRATALAEALNYARQYEEEGTVQVYEVKRKPIGGAASTIAQEAP